MSDAAKEAGSGKARKGRKAEAAVTAAPVEQIASSAPQAAAVAPDAANKPASKAFVQTEAAAPAETAIDTTTRDNHNQRKEMTNMDKAIKTAEDFMAFSQGNVEALLKSSQIWAAGVQDLSKHIAATAQAQIDETMATMKALSGVKSFKEAVDMQTTLTKSALEKAMAETSKLTDATVKLTEETMAPITARVTLATETFTRAV